MTEEPAADTSPSTDSAPALGGDTPMSQAATIRRVGLRVAIIALAVTAASWALFTIFDDLDWGQVSAAIGELSDAEWLSLIFGWLVWVVSQGALTASLVDKLPVRRGVLASLGPTAVSSVIPGPSDLPVRYRMYQSWGVPPSGAATAVAASGIFSVSSQLILPAIAGVLILVADVPLGGFLSVIVTASVALAVLLVIAGFTLGSARRTEAAGRRLDGVVRKVMGRLKKPELDENLGTFLATQRAGAFNHLAGKWLPTTGATILTTATKCALLVMSLRFVGIPEDAIGWISIFAVYGLVAGLTAIPITPGSAGVAEIGFVGMLTAAAGTEWVNQITAGVLLYRMLTWIVIIPVGFGALGVWRHGISAEEKRNSSPST
jgi:uncharacterized membrane protein YbhN (UPF0104 family)